MQRCPECKSMSVRILCEIWADQVPDGFDHDGDLYYDDHSPARCNDCDFGHTEWKSVKDFEEVEEPA